MGGREQTHKMTGFYQQEQAKSPNAETTKLQIIDNQDNSYLFIQSTDGQEIQTGFGNKVYNQQLMYDDDELIEIRPDTMQPTNRDDMVYAPNELLLFRENSKDSFQDDNTFANQSLENVKDTTANNSPINNFKNINVNHNKKEIYIDERMSIDDGAFGTSQY